MPAESGGFGPSPIGDSTRGNIGPADRGPADREAGGPEAGGPGAGEGELAERIGLLELRFRLEASDGSLVFRQVGAALLLGSLRLRLPAASAPRVDAREDPAGARQIRVHVRVALPAVGPLLTYEGTMNIEDTGA